MGRLLLIAALTIVSGSGRAAEGSPFTFTAPSGWTSLSPEQLNGNAEQAGKLADYVKRSNFVFYAADTAHPVEGFVPNVNVVLKDINAPVTDDLLRVMLDEVKRSVERAGPGYSYRVLDQKVQHWDGVDVGRVVAELEVGGQHVKQLFYLLPNRQAMAIVTYTTVPAHFAAAEPLFDQAARATRGLEQPHSKWQKLGRLAMRVALILAAAVTLLSLILAAVRRKKT